jgi:two-component system nitrogen regulation sensor histidine kinase NtrY
MSLPPETNPPERDPRALKRKRQKSERILLILALAGLLALVLVQRKLLNLGPGLSSNQGVITLVSINFSVLTLGLLLFLILRGLYRIFFERQAYGSLQTKMVVSFISLSLIPILLIFYFSYRMVGRDQETWFDSSLASAIEESIKVAEKAQREEKTLFILDARERLEILWEKPGGLKLSDLEDARRRAAWDSLEWHSSQGLPLLRALSGEGLKDLPPLRPQDVLAPPPASDGSPEDPLGPPPAESFTATAQGNYLRLVFKNPESSGARQNAGYFAVGSFQRSKYDASLEALQDGLRKQRAFMGINRPFKVSQLTSLAAVTLVSIFLSVWIGSHLANSLAAPITELVEGTRQVAGGDLDFVLTPVYRSGETAELVASFNQMNLILKKSFAEKERRRQFVETVLKQVSTGVLVLNEESAVLDVNEAALAALGLNLAEARGPAPPRALADLVAGARPLGAGPPSKGRVHVRVGGETRVFTASRARLKDGEGRTLGYIVTFDDLSELEKAQRLSAWREVARRIAHEVKNPLTPISLAAQRLQRRFAKKLADDPDGPIFAESLAVIVRQVENMRCLVDEFSQFARLPQSKPEPASLVKVVEEALTLFRAAHPHIDFSLKVLREPPIFNFDPAQMGRAVTNLLANSAQAMGGVGRVEASVDLDPLSGVILAVSDDGPGLPPETRDRIFEPYVTSGSGQGLGLTIVKTIVADHNGYIRALDRESGGLSIVITLPLSPFGAAL